MSNLLRDGAKMLNATMRAHCSQTVTYQRGSDSVSLQATIGSSKGIVTREYGVREEWKSRDYLFAAADLVLDGQRVEPTRGDRVIESQLDEDDDPIATLTYEVLPPSDQEPCWRYSDSQRLRCRVHTKLLSRVAIP